MKMHSRYFFRGMAEHGLSGLATQAAHLTMPRSVPACKAAVSARTGHQAWARRVPELTTKALDIRYLFYYSFFAIQVLDPNMDLRTVKHFIWKSGGDLTLHYRQKST